MHFRNNRKSTIRNKKLSKPCPYHSRVNSVQHSSVKSMSPRPAYSKVSSQKKQKSTERYKGETGNINKSIQSEPLIEPSFYQYGERLKTDFNYYEDMRLNNEGWPEKSRFGRVFHAKNQDIIWRAQEKVRDLYSDQYYNVREELQTIRKIRQRYKVIFNIQQDKKKLKHILKQINTKKVYIDNEPTQSDPDKL